MPDKLNLYQKLVEVRKAVPYLKKSEEGFKYKYVPGVSVLGPIVEKMNELGLLLVPEVFSREIHIDNDKRIVEAGMIMTWINAENPKETLRVPFLLFGEQNDISKAFGSGLTYSERYFLLKFFNIPTDKDDPDAFQNGKKEKPAKIGKLEKDLIGDTKDKDDGQRSAMAEKTAEEIIKLVTHKDYFPTKSEQHTEAKKKLFDFVFGTHNWKEISSKGSMLLKDKLQTIKGMLENQTILEILLGNQEGPLFDPTAEPITEEGQISLSDNGNNEWKTNLDKIRIELKKLMPPDYYYEILKNTIKGNSYKHANEIGTIKSQEKIIKELEIAVEKIQAATEN